MPDEARAERRVAWLSLLGFWLIRALGWTWRIRVRNDDELRAHRANGRPVIFVLWHGQLLPLLFHHRGEGVAVLISEHADGEIVARIAMRFGYTTVRGSTSRGAARALIGLARAVKQGHDLAITPDGPRGPARSFAPGAVAVAQRTGAAVVGAAVSASRGWRFKSWDRFLVPKPFARVIVAYCHAGPAIGDQADARDPDGEIKRLSDAIATAEQLANE